MICDEVGGGEDLEVAFDVVVTLGAVDDGLAAGVPGDFLEGEWMAEEVLGETFAACHVIRSDNPPFAPKSPLDLNAIPRRYEVYGASSTAVS